MSIPVGEISSFVASDEYKANPDIFAVALELLSEADGMEQSYRGFQVEDPGSVYWIKVWTTIVHHYKFRKSNGFPGVLDALIPAFKESPTVHDIQFKADFSKPLNAPVTEFAYITLKPGRKMDELIVVLGTLSQEISVTRRAHSSSWGPAYEKNGTIVLLVGWDTVDAHLDAIKDGPLAARVAELKEIADVDVKHAKLSLDPKYT